MSAATILPRHTDAGLVLQKCAQHGFFLAGAESLTGGLLADAFVSVLGASSVFLGSAVTYNIGEKHYLLDVDERILRDEGAVDPRVAKQMANGTARLYARAVGGAPTVGVSTTGVAGPDSDGFKPVGLVYIGVSVPNEPTSVRELHLKGDRSTIRRQAVVQAINFCLERLEHISSHDIPPLL